MWLPSSNACTCRVHMALPLQQSRRHASHINASPHTYERIMLHIAVDQIKRLLHHNNIHSSTVQTEILDLCDPLCNHNVDLGTFPLCFSVERHTLWMYIHIDRKSSFLRFYSPPHCGMWILMIFRGGSMKLQKKKSKYIYIQHICLLTVWICLCILTYMYSHSTPAFWSAITTWNLVMGRRGVPFFVMCIIFGVDVYVRVDRNLRLEYVYVCIDIWTGIHGWYTYMCVCIYRPRISAGNSFAGKFLAGVIWVCVYVCVYTHICIHPNIFTFACMNVHTFTCVYIYVCTHVYWYMCVCIYIFIFVCMYRPKDSAGKSSASIHMCMYVLIGVKSHINVCIYIHMCVCLLWYTFVYECTYVDTRLYI